MAGDTSFVVGSAVTAVAAGRVEFAFDLVQGHEVAAMRHFAVRTVTIFQGRLHFDLVGVAIAAERHFMACGAEAVVGGGIETVIFYKNRGVAEGVEAFHGSLLLVFMAFGD